MDFSNTVAMTELMIQCSNDSGSDEADALGLQVWRTSGSFGAFEKRLVRPSSQWCRRYGVAGVATTVG